jgi:G3E family GTPase
MSQPFCILQDEAEEEDGDEDEDEENAEGDTEMGKTDEERKEETYARLQEEKAKLDLPSRAIFKRASPLWKGLLRSKGFCWLATRPNIHGEWSQAGVSLHLMSYHGAILADITGHVYPHRRWILDVLRPRE